MQNAKTAAYDTSTTLHPGPDPSARLLPAPWGTDSVCGRPDHRGGGGGASLFGYIETGSFQYTVCDYHGTEQVVEITRAGDFIGHFPYCLDGDTASTTIVASQPAIVHVVSGRQLSEHFLQSRDGVELAMHYLRYRFARLHQLRRQYYLPTDPWTNKQVPKRF